MLLIMNAAWGRVKNWSVKKELQNLYKEFSFDHNAALKTVL